MNRTEYLFRYYFLNLRVNLGFLVELRHNIVWSVFYIIINDLSKKKWVSPVAQLVKNLPVMWETWVWSLGWEDPQKGSSCILAWRIPWTKSMGSRRVGHDWSTFTFKKKKWFDRIDLKFMSQIAPLLAWILSDVLMFPSNVFGKEIRIVSVELGKYNDEFLLNWSL